MIPSSDRQTDGRTEGRAIAYTRYSIYAVARKNAVFYNCYQAGFSAYKVHSSQRITVTIILIITTTLYAFFQSHKNAICRDSNLHKGITTIEHITNKIHDVCV